MMTTPAQLPPILPVIPENIPAALKAERRWAPWAAKWNPKALGGKGKYGKIPHRADKPGAGLSNNSTRGWTTFDAAMKAYLAAPDKFAGVGYVLTGAKTSGGAADAFEPGRFVGIDLDHCRDPLTGAIEPWAAEVMAQLNTYTEVSPSGTGLRAVAEYSLAADIINNAEHVEIYGGVKARFVTITGQYIEGAPRDVRAPRAGVVDGLVAKYRKTIQSADVLDLHLPPLLSAMDMPDLAEMELAPHAANFFAEGAPVGTTDNSRVLFAVAVELGRSGCTREEIFSLLEANQFALDIALNHREQDYDKALRYLWKHSAGAGEAKAKAIGADLESSFDDLDLDEADTALAAPLADDLEDLLGGVPEVAPANEPQGAASADEFDDLGPDPDAQQATPAKPRRFAPQTPEQFMQRPAPKWLIKGVLPQASLAVVYGASGSGKSFFTFDMCAAIVRGLPWRGARVVQGRGVYVVAEGAGGFRNRLEAYCEQHGVAPAELGMGLIANAPNLMDKLQVNELIVDLKAFGEISFIVMDTYARVMVGGNENDAKDVGMVLAQCAKIHRMTGAMVILVHHSGKDDGAGARGSSALRAAADVEIQVKGDSKARGAKVTKQKDGEDGKQYGFRLHTVVLGEDEDGEDITSCVVEHLANGEGMSTSAELKGDIEKAVFEMITAHLDIGSTSVRVEDLVSQVAETMGYDPAVDKKDRRKERVKRALKSLESKNLIVNNTFEITVPPANAQNKTS